ncbi:MAG: coproporphyrinogen dehydrogenase HemZ, partial [Oscillospiraceae bacterium]|nr:coproporphyrinogen dehydrogenase HemZ [Oscillospiraceae bacterium]
PYLKALYEEIDAASLAVKEGGLNAAAVYIGGGTPTTLTADELSELISRLRRGFDIWDDREFTVEAGRPDTVTAEKLDALINSGVNRISINPQTMSDEVLRAIGRRHTAGETVEAFKMARKAGFRYINMDMIAGLPADTPEGFESSLKDILDLRPENITVHTLALKRGSAITAGGIEIPDGKAVGKMLDFALEALPERGYSPYYLYRQKFTSGGFENVGWRLSGTECLYNICVMEELCSVVALGAGGSSKLVCPGDGRIIRAFNPKYPKEYIDAIESIKEKKAVFAGKELT